VKRAAVALAVCANNAAELFAFPSPLNPSPLSTYHPPSIFPFSRWPAFVCLPLAAYNAA